MHADRRRGRPHSRVLYWFRTPPGVRVGRAPLDEDAIRLIEESNPGVEFDWTRILKGQDAPPEHRPVQHERRARPRPPYPASTTPAPSPRPPTVRTMPVASAVEPLEPAGVPGPGPDATPAELLPPAELEPDQRRSSAPSAASTRLGSEGLARLRARHAEVLARISEKATDPAQREQLKAAAERLNPDTWVTEAEVVAGLESYESVFESVRGVIGQRRNRRRGRPGEGERLSGGAAAPGQNESEAARPEQERQAPGNGTPTPGSDEHDVARGESDE